MKPRLLEQYETEAIPALKERLGRDNRMSIPKLEKIVVSMGVGEALKDEKRLQSAIADLTAITGQKPQTCRAKNAIAAYKLRAGQAIGAKVTLRRSRMYEFLDRLISMVFPRIRDFHGLPRKGFDGTGNYSVGLVEQAVFPEISVDKIQHNQGMNITFVIRSISDAESMALLESMGFPFERNQED